VGFLIVVNVMVFLLAFFLDFFELAFIIMPLLGPAAEKLGIDLIWFGVLMGVNMQTSFMHPPFGFALFYLRSRGGDEGLHRQGDRQADCEGVDRRDLLGRRAVRGDPGDHGRPRHRLPGHGHGWARQGAEDGPVEGEDRAADPDAAGRPAADEEPPPIVIIK
jgi:hypothetical protein